MEDIYDNLENYNEILSHEQLVLENKDLRFSLAETRAELKQVKMDILQELDKLAIDHQQLLENYSSLLKTARAEVERKTDLMTNINANKDDMFLRMLCDKTNMGKRLMKRRNRKVKGDIKLLKDEKKNCNGPEEKCDEKKTLEAKHEPDQLVTRKCENQEPKLKTEYRIPKLTKPKDEIVAKKETKGEPKEEKKFNDSQNEKENKEKKVKAGSILKRRKSMPVLRYDSEKFSSDEDHSTVTARSSSDKNETDAALNYGCKDLRNTPESVKFNASRSSDHRDQARVQRKNSKQKEPSNVDCRNTEHREPSKTVDRYSDQRDSQRINDRHSDDDRHPDHREPRRLQNRYTDRESPRIENRHSGQREPLYLDNRHPELREPRRMQNRHPDRESPIDRFDSRYSGQRELLNLDSRHSDHRDIPRDLRHKLKSYDKRDSYKIKEKCPSREDKYRNRDYRDRSKERHEKLHNYKDRHFDARTHHTDSRQSRRDSYEHRQSERDSRHRILESPPPDKYVRTKSRDRRSNYRMPDRRMEQDSERQRPDDHHESQPMKPSISDVSQVNTSHPINKSTEPDIEHKSHLAKSKVPNEDGEPASKRRRLDSGPEEGHNKQMRKEGLLETLAVQTCQSPDELMAETVQVDTPVKVIVNTVPTGLEDPRLTSKKYKQIIEKNNRIRLSTVTGRNVELDVLPPYSTHIFRSQDPNNKFEEYTEEDLVKGMYMDFADKDCNDTLESGEIDDTDLYSDLQIDDQPSNQQVLENQQSVAQVIPPLLLTAPFDASQMTTTNLTQSTTTENSSVENRETNKVLQESNRSSQESLLENKCLENVQVIKPETSHNSSTNKELHTNEKANEDPHSQSGLISKKFRIPKIKSTEIPSENNESISQEAGPTKPSVEAVPSNPLQLILRHLTSQISGGPSTATVPTDTSTSPMVLEQSDPVMNQPELNTVSTLQKGVSESICANDITDSHITNKPIAHQEKLSTDYGTDNEIELNKDDSRNKTLTKQQIVEGDLELSDDDISDNVDLHNIEKKETAMDLTRPIETKKRKSESKDSNQAEEKKSVEKGQGKGSSKSAKFADLFGDSSSLITPEDLELLTQQPVGIPSEFFPTMEDEAAVHIDMTDKGTLTESGKKTRKSCTKSSKAKKDDPGSKKSSKRSKAAEAAEKRKITKLTQHGEETKNEVPSETIPNPADIPEVNPVVETDDDVVKTIVISTGVQQVLPETSMAVVSPLPQTSFKLFTQLDDRQVQALATSTPVRDVNESSKNKAPIADSNVSEASQNISDDSASFQSVAMDKDAPDVRVILKRRRKRVLK